MIAVHIIPLSPTMTRCLMVMTPSLCRPNGGHDDARTPRRSQAEQPGHLGTRHDVQPRSRVRFRPTPEQHLESSSRRSVCEPFGGEQRQLESNRAVAQAAGELPAADESLNPSHEAQATLNE
jgi:hypothetical protein